MLIEAGAEVKVKDLDRRTPLMFAVDSGSAETVRMLLEAGADVHAQDNEGTTVHDIADWYHPELLELLQ